MKIARKDIGWAEKKGKVFSEFTFDIKEKLDRKKEEDEVPGGILHIF